MSTESPGPTAYAATTRPVDGPRPKVSVLLPTHNRPAWLARALASVLDGAFEDLEVIVSNNGRPADTQRLRERFRDSRVRWVEHAPPSALENFLSVLSLARGTYVSVLHDDDWWAADLLTTLVPRLDADPTTVLASSDHWQVTPDGEIDPESTEYIEWASGRATLAPGRYQPFDALVVRESLPIPGLVFRRDALSARDFPPEVGAANDIWAVYLLARTGGAAHVCRERLLYRTMHADSDFARNPAENLAGAVFCQRRWLSDSGLAGHRRELKRRLGAREQSIGAALLRADDRSAARVSLSSAVRLRPTPKGIAAWTATWLVPSRFLARL
jgi:glycosyltransferase involved in cell wall biosynthesis